MFKYNDRMRIANNMAEKDVEFNKKLNNKITEKEMENIFVERFNYYNKIL